MKTGFSNIALRALTLLSKFVFLLFLGKYSLDESNLGIYGLIVTTIALLIYVLGFDFYVFNTREILNDKKKGIHYKLEGQLVFHLLAYIIVLPFSIWAIFYFEFLTPEFLLVLLLLIISEHLGQELYRLFTTLERSVLANLMLFFRSGVWIWLVLFDFFIIENPIDLNRYLWIWAVLSWISTLFFGSVMLSLVGRRGFTFKRIDLGFIKRGVRMAGIFFMGSISFQVINFADRYMIDFFHGKQLLGVYTAYAQFSNSVEIFTFSAVTMVFYPRLVKAAGDITQYEILHRIFFKRSLLTTFVLIAFVVVLGPLFLRFMDKSSFLEELTALYVLLGGSLLLTVSNVYHYDLYVKNKDRIILISALVAMVVNVVMNLILIPRFGLIGASAATFLAFLVLAVIKALMSNKTTIGDRA